MRKTCVRRVISGLAAAAALAALSLAVAAAELARPLELPAGPAKAGFELGRFNPAAHGLFETFHVRDTELLRDALATGLVADDTMLLVTGAGRDTLGLLTEQMAYHHVAQGTTGGAPWLVTFCVVCNTGTRLAPAVGGRPHTFTTAGVYDGVMVMQDAETKTLWNHITGDALYGPHVGRTLGPGGNVLHMNAAQALARNRETKVAISDRVYVAGRRQLGFRSGVGPGSGSLSVPADLRPGLRRAQLDRPPARMPLLTQMGPDPSAALSEMFAATLGREDARRPRMELGLGIWTGTSRRFYPMDAIRRSGGVVVDTIDGRNVLVHIDATTHVLAAVFVDARRAEVDGTRIRLGNNQYVETGMLFDARGQRLTEERPQQLFTRWYGFVLTFPDTGVFGQE